MHNNHLGLDKSFLLTVHLHKAQELSFHFYNIKILLINHSSTHPEFGQCVASP